MPEITSGKHGSKPNCKAERGGGGCEELDDKRVMQSKHSKHCHTL